MYARILVALDGSADSLYGGEVALDIARGLGSEILAAHVSDVGIHNQRFRQMEPGLPGRYQSGETRKRLRDAHGSLMTSGFAALARGFVEQFLAQASEAGAAVQEVTAEGRNYVQILSLADEQNAGLIILGAQGLGSVGDGALGSTAVRVLRGARRDVLVARRPAKDSPEEAGVLVGVDGSEEALAALRRGASLARVLSRPLGIVAVYDPDFHAEVFRTMARALPAERQAEVGLDKQTGLHREIIDDGLRSLYQTFLDRAGEVVSVLGMEADRLLLRGKPYRELTAHAADTGAHLVVAGRFGHHRTDGLDIGSNAEALVRCAGCSVLVTGASAAKTTTRDKEAEMAWDEDALSRLERIPPFARPMAKKGIEDYVRSLGGDRVRLEDFQAVARRMGMGRESQEADG